MKTFLGVFHYKIFLENRLLYAFKRLYTNNNDFLKFKNVFLPYIVVNSLSIHNLSFVGREQNIFFLIFIDFEWKIGYISLDTLKIAYYIFLNI